MSSLRGARARARSEITAEITAEGRRQLAEHGAAGLSLRAVARQLGMVSSAVYRYVASRDELLTLLIVEAYDSLGEHAERAAEASAGRAPRERWVAVATAIRAWALEHPHEYALVYGSPVPGYAAPADTVAPASRVTFALLGVVADAWAADDITVSESAVDPRLNDDFAALREATGLEAPNDVLLHVLTAWSQLFGLISFELFGQTHGVIEHHDALFEAATRAMATSIGLS